MSAAALGWVALTGLIWCLVGAIYSRTTEANVGFFQFLFLGAVCFAATTWLATPPSAAPPREVLAVGAVMIPSAFAGQLGFLALREAMRRGSHGVGWCMAQSSMLLPFLAGWLCFGEHPGWCKITGMAMLTASLPLLAAGRSANSGRAGDRSGFVKFAFAAFFLIGVQQTLSLIPNRLAVSPAALGWRVPLSSLCGLGWLFAALRDRASASGRVPAPWRSALRPALGYGAAVAAGQWAFFRALDVWSALGAAAAAYPLAIGGSIVLFSAYAGVIRKEHPGRAGWCGMVVAAAAVILLAF